MQKRTIRTSRAALAAVALLALAGLVADGASNREIAQRLHLSVKTVEGTLTRIYRKSGVRSRTQLATLVLGRRSR